MREGEREWRAEDDDVSVYSYYYSSLQKIKLIRDDGSKMVMALEGPSPVLAKESEIICCENRLFT